MSRPHGAFHPKEGNKFVRAPSFQTARKAFVEILDNLSFVKVVTVQTNEKGIYFGEAIETHFRNEKDRPKLVFFDKLGRSRCLLRIGPIHLAQAPLGFNHVSSIPTVGDILVGSLVPNTRKSHLDHVLRGWSSDAKPLWELLRLLKFGTKMSEFECRNILQQPVSNMLQASPELQQARDDIYMTARVILWSTLRPLQIAASLSLPDIKLKEEPTEIEIDFAKKIRLSHPPSEFIDILVHKCNDSTIMESFLDGFEVKPQIPSVVASQAPLIHSEAELYLPTEYIPGSPVMMTNAYEPHSPVYGNDTYSPRSPTNIYEPTSEMNTINVSEPENKYGPTGPPSPIYETV